MAMPYRIRLEYVVELIHCRCAFLNSIIALY